jgi:hypothetical protein
MKKILVVIMIGLFLSSTYMIFIESAVATNSLVGDWKFNEGSGTVVADSSGNGNNGVIYGATWTEGISGSALRFTSTSSYVRIPLPQELTGNPIFTLSLWINIKAWPTDQYAYVCEIGNPQVSNGHFFHVLLDNDGSVAPYGTIRANFAGGSAPHTYSQNTFSTNTWYNWVFVYDKTKISMYQNGVLLENMGIENGVVPYIDPTGYVQFSLPTMQPFNGVIDEVKIYNYLRTSSQIQNDYNDVISPPTSSPTPTISPTPTLTPTPPPTDSGLLSLPAPAYYLTRDLVERAKLTSVLSGQTVSVSPGQSFSVSYGYQIWQGSNPSEIDQLLFICSWTPTWPPSSAYYQGIYSSIPPSSPGTSGSGSASFTAPSISGTYYIWFCFEANYGFDQAANAFKTSLSGLPAHIKVVVSGSTPTPTSPSTQTPTSTPISTPTDAVLPTPTSTINSIRTLTVVSAHGSPTPSIGQKIYSNGETITCSVPNQVTEGSTIWTCIGWTGYGSVPASGSGTRVTISITQESGITWIWQASVTNAYSLCVSPASRSISTEGSSTFTVGTTLLSGSVSGISLSVVDCPSWLSATFSSYPSTPSFSSILTVRVSSSAPMGYTRLFVKSSGGGLGENTYPFGLTITSSSTDSNSYTLTVSPENSKVNLNQLLTFTGTLKYTNGNNAANIQVGVDDPIQGLSKLITTNQNGQFTYSINAAKAGSFLFAFYVGGSITKTCIANVGMDVSFSSFQNIGFKNTGFTTLTANLYIDQKKVNSISIPAGQTKYIINLDNFNQAITPATKFCPVTLDGGPIAGVQGCIDGSGTIISTGGHVGIFEGKIYWGSEYGYCVGLGTGLPYALHVSGQICFGTDGIALVGSAGPSMLQAGVRVEIVNPENTGLITTAACPVAMMLTDPNGKMIGYDMNYGLLSQISSSSYTGPHSEPQFISVTKLVPGTYKITLTGTDNGPYTFTYSVKLGDNSTYSQTYSGDITEGLTLITTLKVPDNEKGQYIATLPHIISNETEKIVQSTDYVVVVVLTLIIIVPVVIFLLFKRRRNKKKQ